MSLTLDSTSTGSARSPRRSLVHFPSWSPRTASLVAATALALMAVLAGVSNFVAIEPLLASGDAAGTAAAISASQLQFAFGIVGLFIVTLLDFIVSAALYTLFRPVHRLLSGVAAWARVVYTLVFIVAISQLVVALTVLDDPAAVLRATEAFSMIWLSSLGLFGVHLLLIGFLAFRSGFMARIFGVLLVIAGLGYLADTVGVWFIAGFSPVFAQFVFVGEVVIIFWLFIRGSRLPDTAAARS